jgi:hypothetical protein
MFALEAYFHAHTLVSSHDSADPSPDSFAAQVGSSFSRIRVRVGAAIAKAAAARFVPDSADDTSISLFF